MSSTYISKAKAFPTIFEVTNTTGLIILGRMQAKAMGYVQFPQIIEPYAFEMFTATSKKSLYKSDTHTPKTPQDCKSKTVRGNQPKGLRTPDKGATSPKRVSQAGQHKKNSLNRQMNPVIPKIKWNKGLYSAEWQGTQTIHHKGVHIEGIQ